MSKAAYCVAPQFCAAILNYNAELVDLLFRCPVLPRPPWYPQSQVDSIACQALAIFFHVSPSSVLGVAVSFDDPQQKIVDDEWTGLVDSLKVFTSRPT
jgi:hypothetical protein